MSDLKRISKTIRIRDDVFHQARVSAVSSRKSLGLWLEEAILEKAHRENGNGKVLDVRKTPHSAD